MPLRCRYTRHLWEDRLYGEGKKRLSISQISCVRKKQISRSMRGWPTSTQKSCEEEGPSIVAPIFRTRYSRSKLLRTTTKIIFVKDRERKNFTAQL